MIPGVTVEKAKRVKTFTLEKVENGFLQELYKDGDKTVAYMTTLSVGAFKGYHLHRVRASHYCILKGRVKIILYKDGVRQEVIMDGSDPSRLVIPKDIATGLLNIGDEEVWLVNYPNPAYDPSLKDEQVEYTEEELESGVRK